MPGPALLSLRKDAGGAMSRQSDAIEAVLDRLDQLAGDDGHPSVGGAVEAMGDRGWGPLLFVPALIEISPIGGIPGVPTLLALVIAIFAVQIVLGRDCMWLPGFLASRSVTDERLRGAVQFLRPAARRLDRWFPGRLPRLTTDRVQRIAAGVCVALCATVPPLEVLPFASTAPMAAIAAFGLAMTLRDGLLMALGFALSLGAAGLGAYLLVS